MGINRMNRINRMNPYIREKKQYPSPPKKLNLPKKKDFKRIQLYRREGEENLLNDEVKGLRYKISPF